MILRHSIIYFFSRGAPGIIGFATIIVFSHLLSPESYGQYALVISSATVLYALFYQWLGESILRFLPQKEVNKTELLAAIVVLALFVSAIIGAAGISLTFIWWESDLSKYIFLGTILTLANAWLLINLELFRSRLFPVRFGFYSTLRAVLALVIGVLLINQNYEAIGALLGLLLANIITSILASIGQWISYSKIKININIFKSIAAYGLPLIASFAVTVVVTTSDRFMLAWLINKNATGLYAAAQGISQNAVGILMTVVNLAAYPIIVQTLEKLGKNAAIEQLRKNMVLLLAVGMPVSTIFIVLGPQFAKVFLGSEFVSVGGKLMPWFAIAAFLSSLRAYYFDLAFYLGKNTHAMVIIMTGTALANIVLNYWLIPIFDVNGAVYASVFSYGISVVFTIVIGRRIFQLPLVKKEFIQIFITTMIMGVILKIVPENGEITRLIIALILGGAYYFGSMVIFNIADSREHVKRIFAIWIQRKKNV